MSTADNKRLIRRYFDAMRSGDPELSDLLSNDVSWWSPPSSKLGGLHAGKAAVLELMASGVGLYDTSYPMDVRIEQMIAEDDWVSVQMILEARTAQGERYHNHYHFAFRIRDGRIREVREHLDTLYAQQKLFS
jgi:ketosteroid isomerase-like protein